MDRRTQPQVDPAAPVRSWRRVLLLVSVALLCVAAGIFLFSRREPTCRGKRLSQWLEVCVSAGELDDTKSAEAAIRQIGADGLPSLLRWIRYEPRQGKGMMEKLVTKLPPRIRSQPWVYSLMEDRSGRLAGEAELGLAILGPQAAPAVPELTRLMRRYTATNCSLSAMRSLGGIGPAGLPALMAVADEPRFPNRFAAVTTIAMNFRGTNGLPALPLLLRSAGDSDSRVARASILALGTMKLQPETVLPVLTNRLHDPKPELRVAAVYALGSFKSQAAQLVSVLGDVLERDHDPAVRVEAVAVAGKFKEQTPQMLPLLKAATKDSEQNVREAANDALRSSRGSAEYFD